MKVPVYRLHFEAAIAELGLQFDSAPGEATRASQSDKRIFEPEIRRAGVFLRDFRCRRILA